MGSCMAFLSFSLPAICFSSSGVSHWLCVSIASLFMASISASFSESSFGFAFMCDRSSTLSSFFFAPRRKPLASPEGFFGFSFFSSAGASGFASAEGTKGRKLVSSSSLLSCLRG
eukprot:TRINITY_DN9749_c0_g6_i2.p1 TRINITY_DN9749_c0_g6~~TRINITY_DN9749_c0_g6_i2.p1  ORF type:complete len:115 (-),score=11.02 TRINITY_DN9749_c0_g6_i2:174-518(-)